MPDVNEPQAAALFASQMLIHVVRNLVYSGAYDAAGATANVHETTKGLRGLNPHLAPVFDEYSKVFRKAIEDAEAEREKQ